MTELSRRDLLRALGFAGAATALSSCTSTPQPLPTIGGLPSPAGSLPGLKAQVVRPGESAYAEAARLYNPRFDAGSRPQGVVICRSAEDVLDSVRYAADSRTPFALRSGGHSYGGWSSSSGLIVDVSGLDTVAVDTAAGLARIGAGAKLATVYSGVAKAGYALPAGSCPTVGITGLALGGGLGVVMRDLGLTCDSIREVEIITADGKQRKVSQSSDPDLFWALRGGGGGSFGAVTSLTVAVRPAPTVHTFFYRWPLDQGTEVFSAWQTWAAQADRKLWSTCKLLGTPGNGQKRIVIAGTWLGSSSAVDGQLNPLLSKVPAPAGSQRVSMSYAEAMLWEAGCSRTGTAEACVSSALSPSHRQAFAATSSIASGPLPAAAIAAMIRQVDAAMPVAGLIEGGVSFDILGGAVAGVPADATAFPHRQAMATLQYTATWADGARSAEPFDAYVRGFRAAMTPWLGDAAYVNYADPTIADFHHAYWGANSTRLRQVKSAYDPHGLFTFPQAVRPSGV